jgi:hypothetical protein
MERAGRRLLGLAFQADREMVEAVDAIATDEGISRADALRKLIRLGLQLHRRRERVVEAMEEAVS